MQCGVYFSHFCQLLFRIAQERQTSHSHTFLYPGSSRCTVELGCCCSSCASNFCDFFSGNCLIIQSHVFCFDNQTFCKLLVSLSDYLLQVCLHCHPPLPLALPPLISPAFILESEQVVKCLQLCYFIMFIYLLL